MVKIGIITTSCRENVEYLRLALESIYNNIGDFTLLPILVDFSTGERLWEFESKGFIYSHRPASGFANNINYGFALSRMSGCEYLGHCNDDIILPSDFFQEALNFLNSDAQIGFVGGVQQEGEEVQISASKLKEMPFPEKIDRQEETGFVGKWGDFSSWLCKVKAATDARSLDTNFSNTGILNDNDWLLRMRKAGWSTWRNYRMCYKHACGVTQRKLRPGFPNDEISIKSRQYFELKWGQDPYTGREQDTYSVAFNMMPKPRLGQRLNEVEEFPKNLGD